MSYEKISQLMRKFVIKLAEEPFDEATKIVGKKVKFNPKLDRLYNDLSFLEQRFKDIINSFVLRLPKFMENQYKSFISPKIKNNLEEIIDVLKSEISPEQYVEYFDSNIFDKTSGLSEYVINETKHFNIFSYLTMAKTVAVQISLIKRAIRELSDI